MAVKNSIATTVGKKEKLSLIQFKTEFNGACQIVSMIYEGLAQSYKGQANFITVDLDKEAGLGKEYGVREVPTILFIRNGKVIDHSTGLTSRNTLIAKIELALGAPDTNTTKTS
ncbi:MAG TPA: thioredoxin family protein [Puia sp.]|nr:thioredoxin family protein [Puia sp.]